MRKTDVMAERHLMLQNLDGTKARVVVRIGTPYWVTSGVQAACPVAIDGLYRDLADIRGIDRYQAIELAIEFVNTLLSSIKTKQGTLLWSDGTPYNRAPGSARLRSRTNPRTRK